MVFATGVFLLLAGIGLLVFGWRLYGQPKVGEQISVWRTLVPVLDEPAEQFYARLYQALKTSLQERLPESGESVEVQLTGMGFGPHRLFASPSLFAERPLYLLVRYQHLKCYIYAAQTPTGLFVSSWGYSDYHVGEGADQRIAFTKRAWKYFSRQTLFQFDAALIFTTAVHELLADTVDSYRSEEGLQPLEALERRPILHAFYQNPFYREQQYAPATSAYQPHAQWSPQSMSTHPAHFNGYSSTLSMPQPLFAMDAATQTPQQQGPQPRPPSEAQA
jgi:hypothetical protein